jgi:hypothetical protein
MGLQDVSDALSSVALLDEIPQLTRREGREIVDVVVALRAKASGIGSMHCVPIRRAWLFDENGWTLGVHGLVMGNLGNATPARCEESLSHGTARAGDGKLTFLDWAAGFAGAAAHEFVFGCAAGDDRDC